MSSLNVNTIGEYTSGNGVTIDGVLVKDGYVGNTVEVDQYLLTADGNADEDPIQDWARPTGTLQSHAGTGMSVSAGIFTFPKTGFWKVSIQARLKINSDTNSAYMYLHSTSNNGTAWDIILALRSETGSATGRSTAFGTTFLDVTDLSNHKVKASFDELSNATIEGGTAEIGTGIFFERLGDT